MPRTTLIAAGLAATFALSAAGTASAAIAPTNTSTVAIATAPLAANLETGGKTESKTAVSCRWYKWKATQTGSSYWWKRYNDCICNNYS